MNGNAPQNFDIKNAADRARMFVTLQKASASFNDVERAAYNTLRDELMQLARGGGTPAHVDAQLKTLAHFLVPVAALPATQPASAPTTPDAPAPVVVSKKIEVQSVDPARSSVDAVVSAPRKRGPDFGAPVAASVTSAPVPVPQAEPVVAVSETSAGTGVDTAIQALRTRLEKTNDELIAFGRGRAFQWLNDTTTGYREYVKELLEIRAALASITAGIDIPALEQRLEGLKKQAESVRMVVGKDSHVPKPETTPPSAAASVPPPAVLKARVSILTKPVVEAAVPPPPPVDVSAPTNYGTSKHVDAPLDIVINKQSNEAVTTPSIPRPDAVPSAPVAVPRAPASGVVTAGSILTEKQKNVGDANAAVLRESTPIDPLLAPEVTKGLNDLLTRWLGTTGFLGIGGQSGTQHPDWIAVRHIMIEDLLHNDGTIPKEIRPETFNNVGENLRAWRDAYKLLPIERELVEHFVRRVVMAGMQQAA